jgi:hypothetical protein
MGILLINFLIYLIQKVLLIFDKDSCWSSINSFQPFVQIFFKYSTINRTIIGVKDF